MNIHENKLRIVLVACIFLFGLFMRTVFIGDIPNGLHRDEVATGYSAYSVLTTGRDEHGVRLPLVFESFGDWKRPINIYLTAIFVPIVGLSELAVRLPIALVGSVTVVLVYLTVYALTNNYAISVISQLLIAISPWHIFMSRTGLGWNVVGVFLFVLGMYCIVNSNNRWYVAALGAVSLGLTLFAYASNQIVTPLYLLLFTLIYANKIRRNLRAYIPAVCVYLMFFIGFVVVYYPVFRVNAEGSSFFSDEFIYSHNDILRADHSEGVLSRIVHNKIILYGKRLAENYLTVLSPQFFFFNNFDNPSYSLVNFGNFYITDSILIVIGLAIILKARHGYKLPLLVLLLLVPLPAALTKNPASSTRTLLLVPIFCFICAYALYGIISWIWMKKRIAGRVAIAAVAGVYIVNFIYFVDEYFVHFPLQRAKHWGYAQKQLAEYLVKHEKNYNEIIIGRPEDSFYSYLLFYGKYNPEEFSETVSWYPTTVDGFTHARKLGKYVFKSIEYERDSTVSGRLIVDVLNEGDKERDVPLHVRPYLDRVATLRLPNGSVIYALYKTKPVYAIY